MSIALDLEQLIAYSEYERAKWNAWVAADPSRLAIRFQDGGRFPTVGSMFEHVFLVESRHLARLEGRPVPESTGANGEWSALLEYANHHRARLQQYITALDEETGRQSLSFTLQIGTFTMTRQTLAIHILLHEVRHLAQIAYASRIAGHAPPGEHDFFYSARA